MTLTPSEIKTRDSLKAARRAKDERIAVNLAMTEGVQFIREPEAARIAGISRSYMNELEATGKFPARIRLASRCTVWRLDEVIDWVERRTLEARANANNRRTGGKPVHAKQLIGDSMAAIDPNNTGTK